MSPTPRCGCPAASRSTRSRAPTPSQFEWYVPYDAHSHHYIVTWGRRVKSEAETAAVRARDGRARGRTWWSQFQQRGRDRARGDGAVLRRGGRLEPEYLYRPDMVITEWRKLASKHNRGIQKRPGARPQDLNVTARTGTTMTESWKTVVPEHDRKILERADFGGRQPWGRRPALLIVDVVRSFTGSKSQDVLEAIGEYTTSCGSSAWETLPRMRTVLDCRARGRHSGRLHQGRRGLSRGVRRLGQERGCGAGEAAPYDADRRRDRTSRWRVRHQQDQGQRVLPHATHDLSRPPWHRFVDRYGHVDVGLRPRHRGRRLLARLSGFRRVRRLLRSLAVLARRHALRPEHQIRDGGNGRPRRSNI